MNDIELTIAVAKKLGWSGVRPFGWYGIKVAGYRPGRKDRKRDLDPVPDFATDAKAVCKAVLAMDRRKTRR